MTENETSSVTSQPATKGKIFIGGLTIDTVEDDLIEHFKKYGEISFVTIKKDSTTGRSRCFGFIDFVDSDAMDNAIRDKHIIKGKEVEIKRAISRAEVLKEGPITTADQNKKLFIGGLTPQVSDDDLKNYFSKYGVLESCFVMRYPNSTTSKGFGFVVFRKPEDAQTVLSKCPHSLLGHTVDVKYAIPRDPNNPHRDKKNDEGHHQESYSAPNRETDTIYHHLLDYRDYITSLIQEVKYYWNYPGSDPRSSLPDGLYRTVTSILNGSNPPNDTMKDYYDDPNSKYGYNYMPSPSPYNGPEDYSNIPESNYYSMYDQYSSQQLPPPPPLATGVSSAPSSYRSSYAQQPSKNYRGREHVPNQTNYYYHPKDERPY